LPQNQKATGTKGLLAGPPFISEVRAYFPINRNSRLPTSNKLHDTMNKCWFEDLSKQHLSEEIPAHSIIRFLKVKLEQHRWEFLGFELVDNLMQSQGTVLNESALNESRLRWGDSAVRY
jgi:hypothetical protein